MIIPKKSVFSLCDYLSIESEGDILLGLSTFRCERDSDIVHFLMESSIPFEKANKSRTYLIVEPSSLKEPEPMIFAYFTIAMDYLSIKEKVSRSMKRKLNGIFENERVPCYLLGQIGKNDEYSDVITGEEILRYALTMIYSAYDLIGGRFVRVDCKEMDKLLEFYYDNDFTLLDGKDENGLCQLVRFLNDKHK